MSNDKLFVITDDTRDGFDFRIGTANTHEEAVALFDEEGWVVAGSRPTTVQISRVYKEQSELKANFATEMSEGSTYISQVWGGWVLEAECILLEIKEAE